VPCFVTGQVVANEFATPPGSLWAYMQQVSSAALVGQPEMNGLNAQQHVHGGWHCFLSWNFDWHLR
jgi:hypothetical protein